MCGRYSLDTNINDLINRYNVNSYDTDLNVREEIFPTNAVPIVREEYKKEIVNLKWGFNPSFAKRPLINARAETVDIKPTFKESFISRRCLITLLTTSAINSINHIHHRMPVIIPKKYEETWLNKENENIVAINQLLKPWDGRVHYE